jgi:translocation and assembly module TamB
MKISAANRGRILATTVGAVLATILAITAVAIGLANTEWGHRRIEDIVARLTGGEVVLAGLTGQVPNDLRATRVELRDDRGTWAFADDVHVQWSVTQLLRGTLDIAELRAGLVHVVREPAPSSSRRASSSSTPGPVEIDRIELPRVELEAPIAGAPAALSVQGMVSLVWPQRGAIDLQVRRIDAPGRYVAKASFDAATVQADVLLDEPAHGLISGLGGLRELGAVSGQMHVHGTRDRPAFESTLAAGALRASGAGSVDWKAASLDVDLTADSPAMAPGADLHWRSLALQAHVHGPFASPDVSGQMSFVEPSGGGLLAKGIRVQLQGNAGSVVLHAVADRLRIPGPAPELLEASPVDLQAELHLDDPKRTLQFVVAHPVASAQGHAQTAGDFAAEFTVVVPQLAPLSSLAGTELQGNSRWTARVLQRDRRMHVDVGAVVDVTGGSTLVRNLIGHEGKVDVALAVQDGKTSVEHANVEGSHLQASVTGTSAPGEVNLRWNVDLPDLAAFDPEVSGRAQVQGSLEGNPKNLRVVANANGSVGTPGFASRPIDASARLEGLPDAPIGKIDVHATLEDAPLAIELSLQRTFDGSIEGSIERADWKSAHAQGRLAFRSGATTQGRVQMQIGQLSDLAAWVDPGLRGNATADIDLGRRPDGGLQAKIQANLREIGVDGARADHLTLAGTVSDPLGRASLELAARLEGIEVNGTRGGASLAATGPVQAMQLKLTSDLQAPDGSPVAIAARATFEPDAGRLALATLELGYRGNAIHLLTPADISLRDGLAVDRLRIGVAGAVGELRGRIEPTLDVYASVRDGASAMKALLGTDSVGEGKLTLDAHFTGSTKEPHGTVQVDATDLRLPSAPGQARRSGTLLVKADLDGKSAAIDARFSAGDKAQLTATGKLPLAEEEPWSVQAKGTMDAAIANPVLAATGRRVSGQLTMDLAVTGTRRAPQLNGTLRLAQGEFQDDNLGAHLTKIQALVNASGSTLTIAQMSAQAGPGTISATGTVSFATGDTPADLHLNAHNAQPFASDLVLANLDADLHLRGALAARSDLSGVIKVERAEINIPNALPPSVGVLDVRQPGAAASASVPAPAAVVGLDLKIDAPIAVFVRGRGIDAEMGGVLQVSGTSAAPQISGGFDLRRGTFDLAGSTLTFTSGRVSFNGTGIHKKIDPTLNFEAENTNGSFTAKLDVTGYADEPKISLSSTPDMPQDEILAQLLFGASVKQLTALQMVQIGAAVATIGGLGGSGGGPLSTVQKGLGLDRLSVGGMPNGGTSVEAGRYVSKRVFVGARQLGTSGGATQAIVEIDLTKHLKAEGAFGSGGTVQGATPDNDPGNSVGLTYQFEY